MFPWLSNLKNELWGFVKYSGTILWARVNVLIGFITSAVGVMDWGPLLSLNFDTGFSRNQVFYLGLIVIVQGVITETIRRRNADLPS